MFVQINKEEFLKEISKKAWYQTNIVIWTIIFLYPLFSIIDFIYAQGYLAAIFYCTHYYRTGNLYAYLTCSKVKIIITGYCCILPSSCSRSTRRFCVRW